MRQSVALDDGTRVQSPRKLALSPDGSTLYATATWGGTSFGLFAIATSSMQVVRRGSSGTTPTGLVTSSDGRHVLATRSSFSARLDWFDATTLALVGDVDIDRPGGGVDMPGGIAVGSDPSLAYVVNTSANDVAVVDIAAGQLLRRLTGFPSARSVGVNWAGTRLVVAGSDPVTFAQAVWAVVDPATGASIGSGVTTGAGGMLSGADLALCPRNLPDPAPSPGGSTAPSGAASTSGASPGGCPVPLVSALDRPRTSRADGSAVIRQAVRLDQRGRYTFMYVTAAGRRVPLLRGSRISRRVLGTTFTAPVRTAEGPAERIDLVARLGRPNASGVRLRMIRRDANGSLCGVTLRPGMS